MRHRAFVAASALLVALLTTGCQTIQGQGENVTEPRSVGSFTALDLGMEGTANVTQTSPESVSVTAQQNLQQYIETTVSGSTLDITVQQGVTIEPTGGQQISFDIDMPSVTAFTASSSGSIGASAIEVSGDFPITVSGSGSITLESVSASGLTVDVSGSGSLAISGGAAQGQSVKMSSSGSYDASGVASSTVSINLSGSGSAKICVSDTLDANVSGTGTVGYYGDPQVNASGSNASNVKQLGSSCPGSSAETVGMEEDVMSEKIVGTGPNVSQNRSVGSFTQVDLGMLGTLTLTQGSPQSVEVTAQENLQEYISTTVSGGVLTIQVSGNVSLQPTKPVSYAVTAPSLTSITNGGSGDVETSSWQASGSFSVSNTGSGKVTLDGLELDQLGLDVKGSGDVDLSGKASSQTVQVFSTGSYEGRGLTTDSTTVTTFGQGDADVCVTDTVNATVNGSGSINIYGNPPNVTKQDNGSGSINMQGDC